MKKLFILFTLFISIISLSITSNAESKNVKLKIDNKDIDVRVSTLPVGKSENVVTRILDNSNTVIDFEKLWFIWTTKRFLERAISKKWGYSKIINFQDVLNSFYLVISR